MTTPNNPVPDESVPDESPSQGTTQGGPGAEIGMTEDGTSFEPEEDPEAHSG